MHSGQWLITVGTTAIKVFSPWFPRAADNSIFTYELIFSNGGSALTVKVASKSTETTGDGAIVTPAVAWARIGTTSFYKAEYHDLNELLRFQFEASEGSLLYRMLPPTWFNKAT